MSRSPESRSKQTQSVAFLSDERRRIALQIGRWTLAETTVTQYIVKDEEFEWDDAKAALNWRDHGVCFEMARDVFKDTFAIEWTDDRHGDAEERFVTVGMVEGRLLFVAYTLRGERIRIISAREAEPRERRRYHNENKT